MVPVPGLSTSQGREPTCQATRATQKVKEAEPTRSKSKGKGKAKVVDKVVEQARKEKVAKLKAEITVNLEIIAQLEG
jgi:hypothetical protein